MQAVGLAVSMIGTGVGAMASFQQSQYQAAVAKANAQVAKNNAEQARQRGNEDIQDMGEEQAGLLGEQMSRAAGSGLDISSPSIIQSRARARDIGVEDARRRITASRQLGANYDTQANVEKSNASAYKSAGTFALISGGLEMATTFIGGAKSIGGLFGSPSAQMAVKPVPKPTYFT